MKEFLETINKEGHIVTDNGLSINVTIKDVKTAYGNIRYLVTPVSGEGEAWVENVVVHK